MKNLKAKLRKNGGFTLIEMLIVVAIIAILIAVSIPLVGSALEDARKATDAANERAFKAELLICYLNGKVGTDDFNSAVAYGYDAQAGKLTTANVENRYGQSSAIKGQMLLGTVDANGDVFMKWDKTFANTALTANGNNLVGPTYKTVAPAGG